MFGLFKRKNGHDAEQFERELDETVERVRQAGDDLSKCLRRIGERRREGGTLDGAE